MPRYISSSRNGSNGNNGFRDDLVWRTADQLIDDNLIDQNMHANLEKMFKLRNLIERQLTEILECHSLVFTFKSKDPTRWSVGIPQASYDRAMSHSVAAPAPVAVEQMTNEQCEALLVELLAKRQSGKPTAIRAAAQKAAVKKSRTKK